MLPRREISVGSEAGQSAVELVAMLPIVVLLAGALWQAVVAGQAVWVSGSAARAAARAAAVGGDAKEAARRALPGALERGLRVKTNDDGKAEVEINVPLVVGSGRLTTVSAQAHFAPQDQ
jgi:pilus assembly protein CpaE